MHGKAVSSLDAKDYFIQRLSLMEPVMQRFRNLAEEYDLVLIEGAGNAAETNLRDRNIANMGFARKAQVPVCLLPDIERGGVIASVVGTREVLDTDDSALIKSFMINKFRGDVSLFDNGRRDIEFRTSWPCRGVIPYLNIVRRLPHEDSVAMEGISKEMSRAGRGQLKVAVPILSRISKFQVFEKAS